MFDKEQSAWDSIKFIQQFLMFGDIVICGLKILCSLVTFS